MHLVKTPTSGTHTLTGNTITHLVSLSVARIFEVDLAVCESPRQIFSALPLHSPLPPESGRKEELCLQYLSNQIKSCGCTWLKLHF